MSVSDGLTHEFGGAAGSGTGLTPSAAGVLVMKLGNTGIGLYISTGAPTVSAIKGSLCINTGGTTTNTRLYINNGTTTWVAVTTAS